MNFNGLLTLSHGSAAAICIDFTALVVPSNVHLPLSAAAARVWNRRITAEM